MRTAQSIRRLRQLQNWTQEEFAQAFQVPVQLVLDWEKGTQLPDAVHVRAMASYFNMTDAELADGTWKFGGENACRREMLPDFGNVFFWESYSQNIRLEYEQSVDEGYDLRAYRDLFYAAAQMPPGPEKEQVCDILHGIVQNARMRDDYPYREPNELDEIRKLRKPCALDAALPDQEKLRKKITGAWMGRVAGCLLGKPLEGIKSWELAPILKESGNDPMHRYIVSADISRERCEKTEFPLQGRSWADTVSMAPPDDDTNYTAIAQKIIERCGRDFSSRDVAEEWMQCQRKNSFCTAERVAYCNIVKGYAPPDTARYKNPYREWIGAQIRGDYFGYINPGDPETAAEMAWRDARISHTKNGIYGEMFVAAMIACAAVTEDSMQIIRGGLAQIPCTSRLYEGIEQIIRLYEQGMTREACLQWFADTYDEYRMQDYAHTISNAQICAAALLYGGGDYGKSICFAVQAAFDTDCNGATVGSIVGMQKGIDGIDDAWLKPLGDTLCTTVWQVGNVPFAHVVEMTIAHMPGRGKNNM